MKKIIVIIDRDRLLSAVYPATGSKQDNRVRAVELAGQFAINNDSLFKGKIELTNESLHKDSIIVSFERAVVNGR